MKRLAMFAAAMAAVMVSSAAQSEVKLPNLFSDHGVLQRDMPIRIWGWANAGETVQVMLHAQTMNATADAAGHWEVMLKPEAAGGPYELKVTGSSKITVKDLLIGDVWVASGQSNMAYGMKGNGVPPKGSTMPHTPEMIAAATVPTLRLLRVPEHVAPAPEGDQGGKWMLCTPDNVTNFSAIGYFFGRSLTEQKHVAIGIIDNAYSGSPIAAWVSKAKFDSDPKLPAAMVEWPAVEAQHKGGGENLGPAMAARKAERGNIWQSSVGFNTMVSPVAGYGIKGAMWYQGESDSPPDQYPYYATLMPAMIEDWRAHWHQGNFPFIIVQISSYKGNGAHVSWGTIRDAQRRSLSEPNTALVVTLDIGDPDDIHPPDKPDAAARIVLAARNLAYGEKIEASGPLFRTAKVDGSAMRVSFDHAAGLTAKGGDLKSFEVAGSDAKFVAATGKIEQDSVVVSSPQVPQPQYVRFGWSNATDANLYNAAGLPASTFTTGPPLEPVVKK